MKIFLAPVVDGVADWSQEFEAKGAWAAPTITVEVRYELEEGETLPVDPQAENLWPNHPKGSASE